MDPSASEPNGRRLARWLRATPIAPLLRRARDAAEVARWAAGGRRPPAPHAVKRRAVRRYARRFDCRVFVETGTFQGDMVAAMQRHFDRVVSIELGEELYRRARERFAPQRHVAIVQGDSGRVLGAVLAGIDRPCLFWLDGHYSAGVTARGSSDTPIAQELAHIAAHPQRRRHVVLIDDARLFTGANGYPTLPWIEAWAREAGYERTEVRDDMIAIMPARAS